jgi:hypothetical protein
VRYRLAARQELDAQLRRLREERLIVIEVTTPADLLCEPDVDPNEMPTGTPRAGVDDLASTLLAARRLPPELTVRVVVLSDDAGVTRSLADTESGFRRVALDRSAVAWRDGIAQRAMGLRQLPAGLVIAAISWVAAYVFGYLATEADGAGVGVLAVSAMIAITIAWVVSWRVVETTLLDWRLDARLAAAYDLLSRARLEFTTES